VTRFIERIKRISPPVEAYVLTALVVAFFLPFLLAGKVPFLRFLFYAIYPDWIFFKECLLRLQIPFWTPYTGCGEPFLANSESAALYPLNCLFLFLPVGIAVVVWMALHFLIGGWGVFYACRLWKISPRGALLASVSFIFSNAMITRMEFAPSFAAFAWYPSCVALFSLWLAKRRVWVMLLLALIMSLQYYAGWPEAAAFTGMSLGLYAAIAGFHGWRRDGRIRQLFMPAGCLLVAAAVAVMLSMAQMLPQWELVSMSSRGGIVDPQLHFGSVHPLSLFTLLIPSLYGIPGYFVTYWYWAPSAFEYEVGAMYVGVVPIIILGMVCVTYVMGVASRGETSLVPQRNPPNPAAVFLLVLLIFSFLYAMGWYSLFFLTIREMIPLLKKFRWPAKILPCFCFALCCLAGMGLDRLGRLAGRTEKPESRRAFAARWAMPLIVSVCAAGVLVCVANPGDRGMAILNTVFNFKSVPEPFRHGLPLQKVVSDSIFFAAAAFVSVWVLYAYLFRPAMRAAAWWTLLAVAVLDLMRVAIPLVPAGDRKLFDNVYVPAPLNASGEGLFRFHTDDYCFPSYLYGKASPALYQIARGTLIGGWAQVCGGFNVEHHCNTETLYYRSFIRIIDDHRINADVKRGLLRMVNCRFDVMFPHEVLFKWGDPPLTMTIVPVADALPRAYVVGQVTLCKDNADVFRVMRGQTIDYASTALVSAEEYRPEDFSWLPHGKVDHSVDYVRYGINDMSVRVKSGAEALLVISDSYYPGWKATVNGRPARIHRVNGAFRGIRVPEGYSAVRLSYFPESFKRGALLTLLSLAVVVLAMFVSLRRGRKSGSELAGN